MLRLALSELGPTHAPVSSFNNHWGVPLTLSRMPAETRFGVFEIGMNHPGEIRPLVKMVRPHVAVVTTVEPVHLAHFDDGERGIAEAKAEIFEGLEPAGFAVLNRDNTWFDLLSERARAHGARIVSFGTHKEADIRLDRVALQENGSTVQAMLRGEVLAYRVGAPGKHLVQNSLAVLAAAHVHQADLTRVLLTLANFRAPKGRGERLPLLHPAGAFTLIDESYNANPASMRAALALLGQASPKGRGRRIAVLGDLLELGEAAPAQHRGLAPALNESGADLVFLAGPMMAELWRHLPDERRGAYAGSAAELEPILLQAIGPGDVIMMKASLGTRLGPVVDALKRRFSPEAA
jgi:UDP-N-acetylmuramoyl-tripeptide--D-alanyl-D-alanine ligase